MFDQLAVQNSESVSKPIPETVWKYQPVNEPEVIQPEPVQEIIQPEIYRPEVISQPTTEVVQPPAATAEPQYFSSSRVSDRMIDDILGDLDVLMTEITSPSSNSRKLPASVEEKAVHNFFRLGKKHRK